MDQTLDFVVNLVQIIAGAATVGAFIYAGLALRRVRHSDQVRLVNDILDSLSQIEGEVLKIFVDPNQFPRTKEVWLMRYFNKLEWLSQLVVTEVINDEKLQESFKDSIVVDYKEIFQKHATEKQKSDDKIYPYFKKLYEKWKDDLD